MAACRCHGGPDQRTHSPPDALPTPAPRTRQACSRILAFQRRVVLTRRWQTGGLAAEAKQRVQESTAAAAAAVIAVEANRLETSSASVSPEHL